MLCSSSSSSSSTTTTTTTTMLVIVIITITIIITTIIIIILIIIGVALLGGDVQWGPEVRVAREEGLLVVLVELRQKLEDGAVSGPGGDVQERLL